MQEITSVSCGRSQNDIKKIDIAISEAMEYANSINKRESIKLEL